MQAYEGRSIIAAVSPIQEIKRHLVLRAHKKLRESSGTPQQEGVRLARTQLRSRLYHRLLLPVCREHVNIAPSFEAEAHELMLQRERLFPQL
jgi:hypothetical protein